MTEIKQQQYSNLELSTQTIVFSLDTLTATLTIHNTHLNYSVCFKIKTKIEKVIEVKPPKGIIKPDEKIQIVFKPHKKIQQSQKQNLQKNLQFLLQAVNLTSAEISKQEEELLWKQIKQKTANIQLGYYAVKLFIDFKGDTSKSKQFIPPFTTFNKMDRDSKYSSIVRTSKVASLNDQLPNKNSKLNSNEQELNDPQMSKKYQELKKKQSNLIKERENILIGTVASKPQSQGSKSIIILLVLFLLSFLVGNYLKTAFITVSQQIPQEEGFFSFL